MSIWWSLHLRREAASVPLARRLLLGAMETAGVDPDVSYDLSVALSEACANAVEHGGPGSGGPAGAGEYHVTAYIDDDMCRIEVTDHGPGFVDGYRSAPRAANADTVTDTAEDTAAGKAGTNNTADLDTATAFGPLFARSAGPARDGFREGARDGVHTDEHGRGLFLIEALADHVDFRNRPGDGAMVCFDKLLKWREDSLLRAS
ncbi:ATP-binding protein [Streptomyces radiopugnans]|uniref:Serine/threonine-protein kinase RsbW n=1 Tax=Streptomyces radiopugnans TaxID=403935 RepID=A0A1H9CIE5_9ACTN|nr:ATP-binding protein [Streptomyces radiopugnans]SEQ00831.1 serine/threonine-protein kinase RsbW [Streptomyces radiopugnans]